MSGLASNARRAPRNARAVMASRDPSADEVDFFPTAPWGGRVGGEIIRELDPHARSVWDPACGIETLTHGLADYFPVVRASDAYLYGPHGIHDFLSDATPPWTVDWIVSNPPFAPGEAFIRQAFAQARRGVAMLMRAGVLEGQERHGLLYGDCPLTVVAPFSERLPILKGRYDPRVPSAAFYAWYFWIKDRRHARRFMVRWPDGQWRPGVRDIAPGARARLFQPSDLKFAVRTACAPADLGGEAS